MRAERPRRPLLLVASATAAVLAVLAVALWPDEPPSAAPDLESLTWLGPSARWDQSYWLAKARQADLTWRLAVALCDDSAMVDRPNCRSVRAAAQRLEAASPPGAARGEAEPQP